MLERRVLMRKRALRAILLVMMMLVTPVLRGSEPADKGLISEARKRFYPGDAYVDISGIDIYPNSYYSWGQPREDAYQKAFDIMRQVTPNKMLALCECQAIPNPDIMAKDGPRWLYCLPWWGPGKSNPPDWVRRTYSHDLIITLDELPK